VELSKLVNVAMWYESGDINDILNNISFTPDFILLNDLKESRCPKITGLNKINIPFGIIVHDLHYKIDKRKQFMKENDVEYVFSIYRDAFHKTFPKYIDNMQWLPHFVNTDIFKDYNLAKEIDYLMMGKVAFYYPLREKIYRVMKDDPGFVYHGHPGYRDIDESEDSEVFVGEDYAKEINRTKIFLMGDSHFHYPLIKYYEVLACNTLLLAPSSNELRDLGFVPGTHFVEIDRYDFLEKARYYLSHEDERKDIAKAGYQMVHANHSVKIRAQQLVDMIRNIVTHEKK